MAQLILIVLISMFCRRLIWLLVAFAVLAIIGIAADAHAERRSAVKSAYPTDLTSRVGLHPPNTRL
ncbi:hypothetical protein [Paraburkholderia sp. GAS334]|uniref:hypothetical protein n=1 Tax=Paraburkholderia sp. GAS334 TaxID=3035131 RepID=UPI003D1B7AAD